MISLNRHALAGKTQPNYTHVAVVRESATFEDKQLLISQLEFPSTISWYLEPVGDHLVLFCPAQMRPPIQTELDKIVANSPILDTTIMLHPLPPDTGGRLNL